MMKNSKPVEIFVLSYNRAAFLRDCLQSILNQTFSNFTVTVLDNHSKEDILGVVNSFNDGRLKLIVNPADIGAYENWMKAYDMASADCMMVFHDDDCMSPRMLERQMQLFKKYPNSSQVSAGVNLVYREAEMLHFENIDDFDYRVFEDPASIVNTYLFGKGVFGCASVLYKTRILKKIRPNRKRFSSVGDLPYMLALSALGPYIQMISPTYNLRVHPGQDSGRRNWSYVAEVEACRYYLEMSGKPKSFRVRSALTGLLAANYAARHPRTPLREWLQALKERNILYWKILVFKLPLYLLRDCIKRFIAKIAPNLYARSVAERVQRKRAMR